MTEISKLKDEEYCESKHKLNYLSLSVIEWCYNVHLAFDISITTWYKSIVLAFFNKLW